MKYFGKGETIFSATLAYFFTWYNALQLTSFGWREVGLLVWAFALNMIIVGVLLYVATRLTKRPIFAQAKAFFFPMKIMLPVALILSALYAAICYIVDPMPMTALHIWVYAVGYVLAVADILLTFYLLTKKNK
jgi:hypothetical protein